MIWDTSPPSVWVRRTPVSLLLPQPIGLALIQQAMEKPFQTAELRWPTRLGRKENTPQEAQKGRPARPQQAKRRRRTFRYVEPLSAARTPLADFFSILLDG